MVKDLQVGEACEKNDTPDKKNARKKLQPFDGYDVRARVHAFVPVWQQASGD
jgi:hypothetical protein